MVMGAKDWMYCCCALVLTAAFIGWMVVAVKYACVVPFRASVDEASLVRMALAAPAGGNGTPAAAASLAYDLSLVVALRGNSRAIDIIRRATPLDAELRFLGRPFARAQLVGEEWGQAIMYRGNRMVYRLAWKGENASLALGPNEVAAFARESAAGVFELQLVVVGKFKANGGLSKWCRIRVTCALRLSVSTAAAPAPFARVECAS